MNGVTDTKTTGTEPKELRWSRIRVGVGRFFVYVGLGGLLLGIGLIMGYYAGDVGARWLGTMLEAFLVICILSLLAIVSGQIIKGSAAKSTSRGTRILRRVIACLLVAALAVVARMCGCWIRQTSPLTSMHPVKFNDVFQKDLAAYREYDNGLERQLRLIEERMHLFIETDERVLTAQEEKFLRDVWVGIYDYAFAMDQIRVFYEDWYRFDPSRVERSYHIRSFLLTFAAELSLYEKSTRLVRLVTGNSNAVKFLNTPYADGILARDSFSQFRQKLMSTQNRARIAAGKQYLLWLGTALKGRQEARAVGCYWLWEMIEAKLALIEAIEPLELAALSIDSDMEVLKRTVERVWFPAQRGVAKWMGDTRVQRAGTYLITTQHLQQMEEMLEPGDILLSRKNWYLSNVGLPGFWPHAILYIGPPEKLKSYFDDPESKPLLWDLTGQNMTLEQYLSSKHPSRWLKYKAGQSNRRYCVIESISSGVVLNTLAGSCGDYMAALRPRLDKRAKAQAIIEAFEHLDKPYDYDFDFATDHALVCTELVWRSYRSADEKNGLNITLVDIAGRKTLPANEFAALFAAEYGSPDAQLEFVCFIDASEKQKKAFFSDERTFLKSYERIKWSFALD